MTVFTITHYMFQSRRSSSGESKTKYRKIRQFLFIFGKIFLPYRIIYVE